MGKLEGVVYHDDDGEIPPCYNGNALYDAFVMSAYYWE